MFFVSSAVYLLIYSVTAVRLGKQSIKAVGKIGHDPFGLVACQTNGA